MLKYLRITVTALSLTACMMLIALWVRSYHFHSVLEKKTSTQRLLLRSVQGVLEFIRHDTTVSSALMPRPEWEGFGFGYMKGGGTTIVYAPYWFPVLVTAMCATVPWVSWFRRFSLRTLLIATTLVAVALGIIVVAT